MFRAVALILSRLFSGRALIRDNLLDVIAAGTLIDQLRESAQARRTYHAADLRERTEPIRNLDINSATMAANRYLDSMNNLYNTYERRFKEESCDDEGNCTEYWAVPRVLPQPDALRRWIGQAENIRDLVAYPNNRALIREDAYTDIPTREVAIGTPIETTLSVATYGTMFAGLVGYEEISAAIQKNRYEDLEHYIKRHNSPRMMSRRDWLKRLAVGAGALAAGKVGAYREGQLEDRTTTLEQDLKNAEKLRNLDPSTTMNLYFGSTPSRLAQSINAASYLEQGTTWKPFINIDIFGTVRDINDAFSNAHEGVIMLRDALVRLEQHNDYDMGIIFRRAIITQHIDDANHRQRTSRIKDLLYEAGAVGLTSGALFGVGEYFIQHMNPHDDTPPNIIGF